jgi:hypothetical protein
MALLPDLPFVGGDAPARARIVPIPGMPGESIDSRILPDVRWIMAAFKAKINDGYATTGHAAGGDHPKGAGVDIVPDTAKGGTWDDIDRLAAFAKKHPETFRWIGYDGVPNHGRGHHLHLSWHGYGTDGDSRPITLLTSDRSLMDRLGDLADPSKLGELSRTLAGNPDAAAGVLGDAAAEAAAKTAGAIVGLLVDAIGRDGARLLLSVALVAGAVAAIGFGAARALGLRTPPLPIPALRAAKALKGAKAL